MERNVCQKENNAFCQIFVKFVKLPPDNSGKCVQSLSLTLSHCSSNLDLLFFFV